VKAKFVQVNMGCAAHALPRRLSFPSRRRRTFLHVSNLSYYKRIDVLFESLWGTDAKLVVASGELPPGDCQLGISGGRNISFQSLGRVSNSSEDFNRFVLDQCDFYIHTSDGDAQATAILENCARGLVPLVTPQSGFACEYALELSLDSEANRAVIERAMAMPDDEYMTRSLGVRRHVEQHHSWDVIYGTIRAEIERERRERI
jgi:glycosyltransferase involved in cell wall biosynthesis